MNALDRPTPVTLSSVREVTDALNRDLQEGIAALGQLYDDDMLFEDPLVKIRGRDRFIALNRLLGRLVRDLRLTLFDAAEEENELMFTWSFVCVPWIGPTLRIEGSSHLHLREGLIVYHRDYYDVATSLVGSLPVVGGIYRGARRLLA